MSAKQGSEFHKDDVAILGLLEAVDDNAMSTQRHLAHELGVALGLANMYLKRCINKGLIKVAQAPANRYAYYLTPLGMAEKTRLAGRFLTQGFHYFRLAREEYGQLFATCVSKRYFKIVVHGLTDLTEVAVLCSHDIEDLEIIAIVDPSARRKDYQGIPVLSDISDVDDFDALIIADVGDPQREFDRLREVLDDAPIIVPNFLGVRENV